MRKLLTVLPLLLCGCFYNQTGIQGDYEGAKKECQAIAETKIERYQVAPRNEKDRNAELVTLFSDCMAKEGWQVATPKREAGSPPPVSGTQMGQNRGTAEPAPTPQQAPVQDGAVQTQATPLTPSGSMPPLRQPVNPNAATYQPAPYSDVPAYGSGPGRSF